MRWTWVTGSPLISPSRYVGTSSPPTRNTWLAQGEVHDRPVAEAVRVRADGGQQALVSRKGRAAVRDAHRTQHGRGQIDAKRGGGEDAPAGDELHRVVALRQRAAADQAVPGH